MSKAPYAIALRSYKEAADKKAGDSSKYDSVSWSYCWRDEGFLYPAVHLLRHDTQGTRTSVQHSVMELLHVKIVSYNTDVSSITADIYLYYSLTDKTKLFSLTLSSSS